jgi:DNA invertase Pin-like site-specific DNA recombinase
MVNLTTFEMNNAIENAFNPKLDKYAIYLRKSREDLKAEARGEGETLARHKKILTDHAARRGLYVETIYEEVVSGETIEAREQIQKLISECYAGKYKGILVVEVSRLSRGNQGDAQTILDCLKFGNNNNGILVVTPTKTYDVAHNSDDEEYMEFELFMSRREYKMITKRMQRGREQAVVEGNYIHPIRPYGYDIVETKHYRTLEENPAEANIVRQIYDWRVNKDMTTGAIAKKLTLMGVPTYTGVPEWHRETVKAIVSNPVYKGKVKYNYRMTVKKMEDGQLVKKLQIAKDSERYMEYEGKHKAIVSEEIFAAAQEKTHRDKTKPNYTLKNPLAGLLVCKKCQKVLLYQTPPGGRPPFFHHRPSALCKVKAANATDVMEALVYGLKSYLENFEVELNNKPDADESEIQTQIHTLENEKKKVQRILGKIFDDYENEVYSANEFVQRKAKHNARIDAIEKEIRELEAAIPEREEYQEKISYLHDAIEVLQDDTIPAEPKNVYLKEFIQKIEFSRESAGEFVLDIHLY